MGDESGAESKSDSTLGPRRRRLRFGLRTLLLTMAIAAVLMGTAGTFLLRLNARRQAVSQARQYGWKVYLDHEIRGDDGRKNDPLGPDWVRRYLGDDAFSSVAYLRVKASKEYSKHYALISKFPNLVHLDIAGTEFIDRDMRYVAGAKELKTLVLRDAGITNAGLSLLGNNSKLTTLALQGTNVDASFLEGVQLLAELQELSLSNTKIQGRELGRLRTLANLQKISLRQGPPLARDDWREISQLESLQGLSLVKVKILDGFSGFEPRHLRRLEVAASNLTREDLIVISKLRTLEMLIAPSPQWDDDTLASLVEWPYLQTLFVRSAPITDQGAEHLAKMASLRVLDVSFSEITDQGAARFAKLKDLKRLTLGPHVSIECASQLAKELPDCEIAVYDQAGIGIFHHP